MTRKLSETFGLSDIDEDEIEINENIDINYVSEINNTSDALETIDEPTEDSGIDEHVKEMNQIYEIALDAHNKTIEFGFGVDPKNSSPGLSASSSFLNIALNASKSKIDKKLSILRINLEKEKNKLQAAQKIEKNEILEGDDGSQETIIGEVMDRNDLMSQIKEMIQEQKESMLDDTEPDDVDAPINEKKEEWF